MKKCAADAFLMDVSFGVHGAILCSGFYFWFFLQRQREWHGCGQGYVFDKIGFSYVGYAAIRGLARTACSGVHIQINPRT
jgi:hypothetical protein